MKDCRYCYTSIHAKASICPECKHPQTFGGWLKGFVITGFPILAAIVSIGFAIYEKTQANIAHRELAVNQTILDVQQSRSEVAEDAVIELSQALAQAAGPVELIVSPDGDSDPQLTSEEKLAAIEKSLAEHIKNPVLSAEQIKQKNLDALKLKTNIKLRGTRFQPNRNQ